jgi:hypothetical protein
MQLPFYGSFTLRDEGGDMADGLYPVLSWLTWPMSIGKWAVEGLRPALSCWIPTACCASLPTRISWFAKPTSSVMTLLPTAVNSRRLRT